MCLQLSVDTESELGPSPHFLHWGWVEPESHGRKETLGGRICRHKCWGKVMKRGQTLVKPTQQWERDSCGYHPWKGPVWQKPLEQTFIVSVVCFLETGLHYVTWLAWNFHRPPCLCSLNVGFVGVSCHALQSCFWKLLDDRHSVSKAVTETEGVGTMRSITDKCHLPFVVTLSYFSVYLWWFLK